MEIYSNINSGVKVNSLFITGKNAIHFITFSNGQSILNSMKISSTRVTLP
jgi:hypothetical protein